MATGVVIFFASGFFGVAKRARADRQSRLVEPSVPAAPGVFAPYFTSDICRNMNRPSCTAVQEEGRVVKAVPAKWHRSHGPARERRNVRRAMRRGSSCMDILRRSRRTSKTSMLLQELEKG